MIRGLFVSIVFMCSSCWLIEVCEEPPYDGVSWVFITVVDDQKNFLLGSKYSIDSLKAFDLATNKEVAINNQIYQFSLDDRTYDVEARDREMCPTYSIQFRKGDIDTLQICYRLVYEEKCSSTQFTSLKLFWNGKEMPGNHLNRNLFVEK